MKRPNSADISSGILLASLIPVIAIAILFASVMVVVWFMYQVMTSAIELLDFENLFLFQKIFKLKPNFWMICFYELENKKWISRN